MEPNPADPWASRLFLVKWRCYAYVHCTYERRSTLEQLAGSKRMLNYIRKVPLRARGAGRLVLHRVCSTPCMCEPMGRHSHTHAQVHTCVHHGSP